MMPGLSVASLAGGPHIAGANLTHCGKRSPVKPPTRVTGIRHDLHASLVGGSAKRPNSYRYSFVIIFANQTEWEML